MYAPIWLLPESTRPRLALAILGHPVWSASESRSYYPTRPIPLSCKRLRQIPRETRAKVLEKANIVATPAEADVSISWAIRVASPFMPRA